MRHEFDVIRLWEQATEPFLELSGLLPLAVLTNTPDRTQTLRQVAERIEAVPELGTQSNIAASASILAGLRLEKTFINQVLRREIMEQSVIYQEWREEFLQEGREKGREEGRQEGERRLILRQLNSRVGEVSSELRSQVQSLPIEELESLGEALLDFASLADLEGWLAKRK